MMNEFIFLNPDALYFLFLPVVAAGAGILNIIFSKRRITAMLPRYFSQNRGWQLGKLIQLVIVCLALVFSILAAARPSWSYSETTVSRKGRDVVFVIDVSRSMLAEDLYPNRLERAKLSIIDALGAMENDRVALVAFAGNAVVKSPLTLDYSYFKQAVESLGPDSAARGGSMIGDALRKVMNEVFIGDNSAYRDVILITDGEDQESYPLQAADQLGVRGIRLIVIGLGDENKGQKIPLSDANGNTYYLSYEGEEVLTRLDADTLRAMVTKSNGGRYLNVSTGSFDLKDIYGALIKSQEKRFIQEETNIDYDEGYHYFLFPAVILLFAFILGRSPMGGRA